MNRFGMWMSEVMRGRYGMDNLNRALMLAALIVIIADMFLRSRILDLLTLVILIYVYCRMFSRNINARYNENQKYLRFTAGIRGKLGRKPGNGTGGRGNFAGASQRDKAHRILRCPGCGEKLRVPRGAGKIMISCPHCSTKFTKKV